MKKIFWASGVVVLLALAFSLLQQPDTKLTASVAFAQEKKMEQKGMGDMKMMGNKQLDKVRADLDAEKKKLAKDGQYSCCNAPACDMCALDMNMCPCRTNLKKGEGVCEQCKGGWMAGHGDVEGVKAEDVKSMPAEMSKMGYDMRAKMMMMGKEMKDMKKK